MKFRFKLWMTGHLGIGYVCTFVRALCAEASRDKPASNTQFHIPACDLRVAVMWTDRIAEFRHSSRRRARDEPGQIVPRAVSRTTRARLVTATWRSSNARRSDTVCPPVTGRARRFRVPTAPRPSPTCITRSSATAGSGRARSVMPQSSRRAGYASRRSDRSSPSSPTARTTLFTGSGMRIALSALVAAIRDRRPALPLVLHRGLHIGERGVFGRLDLLQRGACRSAHRAFEIIRCVQPLQRRQCLL